jgi:reactive intermediate/imine deaminase
MANKAITTDRAPQAIGTYSQAIEANGVVYLSGQIPLDPISMELVSDTRAQIHQVFRNLAAVAQAADATLADTVKLTIYLTDLANFGAVNEVMAEYIDEPFPARAAVQVSALPRGAQIEADAILVPQR